ncbi:MAG: Flp pilus assembly complex ATPase component TadA [Nitrospirae bacterium]|nr:Flp pilus assembly complex ATPase component TadA [Candidatus Troglogloeales bacterium]
MEKQGQGIGKIEVKKKLGDTLMESGLLTKDQLRTALLEQMKTGKRLGDQLLDLKLVSESQLAYCLASQAGILFVDPTAIQIPPELFQMIPEDLAKRHLAVPLQIKEDKLMVAMVDPLDYESIADLRFHTSIDIMPVVAARREILETIDQSYHLTASIEQVLRSAEKELGASVQIIPDQFDFMFAEETGLVEEGNRMELLDRLVNYIMTKAIKLCASDIHIEPGKSRVWVRYRIDGILKDDLRLPKGVQYQLLSKIKLLSKLKTSERKVAQDGAVRVMLGQEPYDLRVSIMPGVQGEKVTIQIMDQSKLGYDFDQLGFSTSDIRTIQQLLKKRKGLVLATGPTGTGKTTTLYRLIKDFKAKGNSVTTIEDPVEYSVDGINQIQVDSDGGMGYAATLKALLRQDPNVILIGEIRDLETAEIALRTAMSGYLVFSSLPTTDAISAISLLINLGVPRYLVATTVTGIIGQRLIRVLCPQCKGVAPLKQDPASQPSPLESSILKAQGCKECNYIGYKGRTGIFEVVPFSTELRNMITSGATEDEIRAHVVAEGTHTIYDDGMEKIKEGLTTLEEVHRVIETEDIPKTHCPQCQHLIQMEYLICPLCGTASPYVCASCGKPQQKEWAICPYCRHHKTEPRATPPAKGTTAATRTISFK